MKKKEACYPDPKIWVITTKPQSKDGSTLNWARKEFVRGVYFVHQQPSSIKGVIML